MQVAAGDSRVLVAGDPLEDVQLDAGVRHPGQRCVPQAVPDEAGLADPAALGKDMRRPNAATATLLVALAATVSLSVAHAQGRDSSASARLVLTPDDQALVGALVVNSRLDIRLVSLHLPIGVALFGITLLTFLLFIRSPPIDRPGEL